MAQLALNQATIEYQQFGPQDSAYPPVLFVHGILVDGPCGTASPRAWPPGFRCICRNGRSAHTPFPSMTAARSHRVASRDRDSIVAQDLSDVTLVGNDTGGGLCQMVVDEYPDRIGRLVLTNCDAFDKFPPFPFTVVFGLLRGPISIKALFEQMRFKALRHSPLGFGLLIRRTRTRA